MEVSKIVQKDKVLKACSETFVGYAHVHQGKAAQALASSDLKRAVDSGEKMLRNIRMAINCLEAIGT